MLKTYFWTKVLSTDEFKKHYFYQDEARPHTVTMVQRWLKEMFGYKLNDKDMWQPGSSDLNPCDYFL